MEKEVKFNLAMKGEHKLKRFTLADEIWMLNEFGEDLANIFNKENFNMDIISRIVFRLLEDKSMYKAISVIDYDEDGEEIEKKIGGYKLFQRSIVGVKEKIKVLNACVENINVSSNNETETVITASEKGDKKKAE